MECSRCGKIYDKLNREFEGWGRRTLVPQRRWHSQSDVKRVTFAVEVPVCAGCGGEEVKEDVQVPLWRAARDEWAGVTDPELLRLRPKVRK